MISALLDNQAWEMLGGILMYQVRHPYPHLLLCLLTLELFSTSNGSYWTNGLFRSYVGRDAVCVLLMNGTCVFRAQNGKFASCASSFLGHRPCHTYLSPRKSSGYQISTKRHCNTPMSIDGRTCTIEEQALSQNISGTNIVCLTRGDTIGLTLVAESGFISLIALLGAFIVIFVSTKWMSFMTSSSKLTTAISE